ncbi:MAG: hypothetical protein QNJ27_04370 [Simkaniaceae bacterium]|nr:hypothetical protein [Simkaniaceae bacterium]
MSTSNSIPYQRRDFDRTYLFQVNNEGKISLKVLDLAQKCLFKKAFSAAELSLPVSQLLAKGNFSPILERLVEKQSFPKEHLPAHPQEVTPEKCERLFDQIIEQLTLKRFVARNEREEFICPLTLETLLDPVIDEHGHTFEKSAIETYLQRENACPIDRQPIHSLIPNRSLKQIIQNWQEPDPVPNFSLFKEENPRLASANLQMVQTYVEEKKYQQALDFYAKALQSTKSDEDYAFLPTLFELMGDYDKATLAYLYLAKYQLLANKTSQAIETLESCQRGHTFSLQNNLALIELYYRSAQPEKALALSFQTAEIFSTQNPEQAITLYKRLITDHPAELSSYSSLAALVESPQEKAHILLKGALEAIRHGDYAAAEKLTQKAESHSQDSFVDSLVSLDLIKKQGPAPRLKQKLLYLADAFEKKGLTKQLLSTYKMLFQLDKNPDHCQKILSAYQTLQKPQKEFAWSLTLTALLIEQQQWEQAETVAKETLQKVHELEQRVPLYENLEKIYTAWNGHKLQNLWPQLGKAYRERSQLDLAEKTYKKAFERFHQFADAIALAETLKASDKTRESVHTYYEAAVEALLEQNSDKLALCTQGIKQIDPHLQQLDLNQRMYLLAQEQILKQQTQIVSLEQVVQPLREQALVERKMREEFSHLWFGKEKWEKYFGEVGVEPPFPKDLASILQSPCPYWEGKTVGETHMLVLIPQFVNGRALTLNFLEGMIQSPQGGGHKTKYSYYSPLTRQHIGSRPAPPSYWALMTKHTLPSSKCKTYSEKQALIKNPYAIPRALEIATGILMHHVQAGERLYSNEPRTWTFCQEALNMQKHALVGDFESYGLQISDHLISKRDHEVGLAVVRRF